MGLKSTKILGISVTKASREEILEYVRKYLLQAQSSKLKAQNERVKPLLVVTPNPEQIILAQKDTRFADMLNQADVAIPDGIGLVVAMRLLAQTSDIRRQTSDVKRIPGIEFMEDLVKIAAEKGYSIGLIGGRGGVAVKALECLQSKYPGLGGWAEDGPEVELTCQVSGVRFQDCSHHKHATCNVQFETKTNSLNEEIRKIVDHIRKSHTRMIFGGLGAPKQEFFIDKLATCNLQLATPLILMSVGGSFDIISGRMPRAPHAIQAVYLEWLWRLVREPWRWRRQVALMKFIWLVLTKS